jgi:hypothetical protein
MKTKFKIVSQDDEKIVFLNGAVGDDNILNDLAEFAKGIDSYLLVKEAVEYTHYEVTNESK